MTAELVLFILVATVAIFSAALMLVSRNAVHSALFLVVNLLCVAFFYLMLNAPFLAMVQVTVYAGAIMVLFMFVIMLLGSEKLGGAPKRYSWVSTGAVGLVTVFLVVAFVAVSRSDVRLTTPVPHAPEIRFVHAVPDVAAVDIYLGETRVAGELAYGESTEFARSRAGNYELLIFASCTEEDKAACPNPMEGGAFLMYSVRLDLPADDTTFVLAGKTGALQLITAATDLSTVADESTWRLTVVNAMIGQGLVSIFRLNPSDPANPEAVLPGLDSGAVSSTITLAEGNYSFAFRQGDTELAVVDGLRARRKHHELLVLAPEIAVSAKGESQVRPAVIHIEPAGKTAEAFGAPQNIGVELLTTYLLAFELIAVLLLATMVGAIILTREEVVRRVRQRLVVSPVVKRMNLGIQQNIDAARQNAAESTEA